MNTEEKVGFWIVLFVGLFILIIIGSLAFTAGQNNACGKETYLGYLINKYLDHKQPIKYTASNRGNTYIRPQTSNYPEYTPDY